MVRQSLLYDQLGCLNVDGYIPGSVYPCVKTQFNNIREVSDRSLFKCQGGWGLGWGLRF